MKTDNAKETKLTRGIRILGAATVACLVAAGGATAKNYDRPARPAHDIPAIGGLTASLATTDSSTTTSSGWATRPSWMQTTFGASSTQSAGGSKRGGGSTQPSLGGAAPGAIGAKALVLYDTTGAYGWLGELYATTVGNLASHFGTWKAEPVSQYTAGQIGQYTATIYIGSTYDEPLSATFLTDVANATHPVIWVYDNIWELSNQLGSAAFQAKYGWMWSQFDLGNVSTVVYKGSTLTRDGANNQGGIMSYGPIDTTKAQTLAWAVRDSDQSQFPWAIRSGSLTYVGENPFTYTTETDRVIAFEDLLYDALNPFAQTRHRAMIRFEDINPSYAPADLRAVTDYLKSQNIPFGFGAFPVYTDPNGTYNNGTPEGSTLTDRGNGVADALKYMIANGGTPVMHGFTHQYSNQANPYDAVSGDDFEFYRVTENADHTLDYQGPIPRDSTAWAADRMTNSARYFQKAKLPVPQVFEFPHYAASVPDYQAAASLFGYRWERSMYYGGSLTGGTVDYSHVIGQAFPYVVRDVYGSVVLPENLGPYAPEEFFQFKPHTVDDILAGAKAELSVRDGIATFYYHPFEGVAPLQQIVAGLKALGYTFVSPTTVMTNG